MYKYEINIHNPTRTVGATELKWDARRTDEQMDRWMDGVIDIWLIFDWYFISKKCTYIHNSSTYRQKKEFHLYPNIYVPLGGHQRNYIEFIEAGSLIYNNFIVQGV